MLPCNADAVAAWLASQTQWRLAPSGRLAGLDYAGARAAVAGAGLRWRRVFGALRTMEAAALEAQSEASAS